MSDCAWLCVDPSQLVCIMNIHTLWIQEMFCAWWHVSVLVYLCVRMCVVTENEKVLGVQKKEVQFVRPYVCWITLLLAKKYGRNTCMHNTRIHTHTRLHTQIYVDICVFIFLCIYFCGKLTFAAVKLISLDNSFNANSLSLCIHHTPYRSHCLFSPEKTAVGATGCIPVYNKHKHNTHSHTHTHTHTHTPYTNHITFSQLRWWRASAISTKQFQPVAGPLGKPDELSKSVPYYTFPWLKYSGCIHIEFIVYVPLTK